MVKLHRPCHVIQDFIGCPWRHRPNSEATRDNGPTTHSLHCARAKSDAGRPACREIAKDAQKRCDHQMLIQSCCDLSIIGGYNLTVGRWGGSLEGNVPASSSYWKMLNAIQLSIPNTSNVSVATHSCGSRLRCAICRAEAPYSQTRFNR